MATVETDDEFSFGVSVELFAEPLLDIRVGPLADLFDVARDSRFVMMQRSRSSSEAPDPSSIVVA
jgi:hypothetical protein